MREEQAQKSDSVFTMRHLRKRLPSFVYWVERILATSMERGEYRNNNGWESGAVVGRRS